MYKTINEGQLVALRVIPKWAVASIRNFSIELESLRIETFQTGTQKYKNLGATIGKRVVQTVQASSI